MVRNDEVAEMVRLVGIDPSKIPAGQKHVREAQAELFLRYIGYKCGLLAARPLADSYDLGLEDSALLGEFVATQITFPADNGFYRSVFDDMRRMLALVEGATGYPMTAERNEARALGFFMKAVLDDIRTLKSVQSAGIEGPNLDNRASRMSP